MKSIKCMSENEKIVATIKELGAKDFESAVTLSQIIDYAISKGYTEDYPRGKQDGHPWFPRTSVMMGVGSVDAVMQNEEFHIHRKYIIKDNGGKVMMYWYDPTLKHEIVSRKTKASNTKKKIKVIKMAAATSFSEVKTLSDDEKMQLAENTGQYRVINNKLISETWIQQNPEKFKALYGGNA